MASFLKSDQTNTERRFYTVALTRDLFDGWTVIREWAASDRPALFVAIGIQQNTMPTPSSLRPPQSASLEATC
jgi:hypothetical protein